MENFILFKQMLGTYENLPYSNAKNKFNKFTYLYIYSSKI